MTSFYLDYLWKDPISRQDHILKYQTLGLQRIWWRGHNSMHKTNDPYHTINCRPSIQTKGQQIISHRPNGLPVFRNKVLQGHSYTCVIVFCQCLPSCYSSRVKYLQLMLYGPQSLKQLQKKFAGLCFIPLLPKVRARNTDGSADDFMWHPDIGPNNT